MSLPFLDSFSTAARQGVWCGDALGMTDAPVLDSGHEALNAQLPGGGWPLGAMTEVLQSAPGAHVWQLLLPVLAEAVEARGGPVALIGAPHEPFGPSLAAAGLPVEALLSIRCQAASARLWACEQALRCADIAAVLAWLPQARVGELRRLQLAAAQHQGLLFVFRPESAAQSASPARLRLQLGALEQGLMEVRILKRRGPPLAAPLTLPACSERITALLAASQWRRKRRQQDIADATATGPLADIASISAFDAATPGAHMPGAHIPGATRSGGIKSGGATMPGATVLRLDLRHNPDLNLPEPSRALDRAAMAA